MHWDKFQPRSIICYGQEKHNRETGTFQENPVKITKCLEFKKCLITGLGFAMTIIAVAKCLLINFRPWDFYFILQTVLTVFNTTSTTMWLKCVFPGHGRLLFSNNPEHNLQYFHVFASLWSTSLSAARYQNFPISDFTLLISRHIFLFPWSVMFWT